MSMRWADSDSEDEAFIAAATAAEEAERAAMQPSGLNDGTVPGLGQVSKHLLASGCLRVRLRIGTKAQLRPTLNSTVSLPLHSPPPHTHAAHMCWYWYPPPQMMRQMRWRMIVTRKKMMK